MGVEGVEGASEDTSLVGDEVPPERCSESNSLASQSVQVLLGMVLVSLAFATMLVVSFQPKYTFDEEIPLRDGFYLQADIYLPRGSSILYGQQRFPTIFVQQPYDKSKYHLPATDSRALPLLGIGSFSNMSVSKYAFVVVDIRCTHASMEACSAVEGA